MSTIRAPPKQWDLVNFRGSDASGFHWALPRPSDQVWETCSGIQGGLGEHRGEVRGMSGKQ